MAVTVFANGVWKSGTNMLVKLCRLLGWEWTRPGLAASLLHGRWRPVRRLLRGPHAWNGPALDLGLELLCPVGEAWLRRKLAAAQGRCLSGHAAWSARFQKMLDDAGVRTLHIVRDPRDLAVSFAHWIPTRPDYYAYPYFTGLDLDSRVLRLLQGAGPMAGLPAVLAQAAGWLHERPNTLLLRFEDLADAGSKNQFDAVASAARFLGAQDAALEQTAGLLFGGTPTFRQGLAGGWQNDLQPATSHSLQAGLADALKEWGYA